MTCSNCWTSVPAGQVNCPRCGAKVTGAPPSFLGLLKAYPWVTVLLGLSGFVTLWAVTRRPPPIPEPIPPAIEPVVETPVPEPEPALPLPVFQPPVAEPAAPPPTTPVQRLSPDARPPVPGSGRLREDGTWESSGSPMPGGR